MQSHLALSISMHILIGVASGELEHVNACDRDVFRMCWIFWEKFIDTLIIPERYSCWLTSTGLEIKNQEIFLVLPCSETRIHEFSAVWNTIAFKDALKSKTRWEPQKVKSAPARIGIKRCHSLLAKKCPTETKIEWVRALCEACCDAADKRKMVWLGNSERNFLLCQQLHPKIAKKQKYLPPKMGVSNMEGTSAITSVHICTVKSSEVESL